jgi:biotin operon repressor
VSIETMALVLHHSKATGTAKLVLLGIANHAGDGGAWPSRYTLAKYAGCSEDNVRKAVKRLKELGEIRVHVQGGGLAEDDDAFRPNRYDVLVACPGDCDRTPQHRTTKDRERQQALWRMRSQAVDKPPSPIDPPIDSAAYPPAAGTPKPSTQPSHQESASTTGHASGRIEGWCDGCGLTFQAHLRAIERGTFKLHNFTAQPPRREATP